MSINSQTDFYLDFGRYGDLRREARNQSNDAIKAVARQFEGLMLQQMLASMRSSVAVDEANRSSSGEFYQEMYDKQLSQVIASSGGLGLAELIANNAPGLARKAGPVNNGFMAFNQPGQVAPAVLLEVMRQQTMTPQSKITAVEPDNKPVANDSANNTDNTATARPYVNNDFAELSSIEARNRRWAEPLDFVSDIWPHASKAANQLGINPRLLVAQAALETGWGQHMMKFADGRNGFNLFGIKASNGWQGAVLARPSLEYRNGIMQSEVSRFRAYASPADSFQDYVNFIRSSGRYQNALGEARLGNDEGFIRGIHNAGYATDPRYADKVLDIANGHRIKAFLAATTSDQTGVKGHA